MMSKERELLKELSTKDMVSYYYPELINRIKELLAQPEHKEEPVAWMYEREHENFTELTLSVGFEKNFDGVTTPLYTAPPEQKPLSADKIWSFSHLLFFDAMRQLEKAHGIGVDDEQHNNTT